MIAEYTAARRSNNRATNAYVAKTPSKPQTASGKRPAHSCRPNSLKPRAMEENGSWGRPRSFKWGNELSAPDRLRLDALYRFKAMRRERSATLSSKGSQRPLLLSGGRKKKTTSATPPESAKA